MLFFSSYSSFLSLYYFFTHKFVLNNTTLLKTNTVWLRGSFSRQFNSILKNKIRFYFEEKVQIYKKLYTTLNQMDGIDKLMQPEIDPMHALGVMGYSLFTTVIAESKAFLKNFNLLLSISFVIVFCLLLNANSL